jgi:starch synthase (maltosyl-transferring)
MRSGDFPSGRTSEPAEPQVLVERKPERRAEPSLNLRGARIFAPHAMPDDDLLSRAARLGFNALLVDARVLGAPDTLRIDTLDADSLRGIAQRARTQQMQLVLDLELHRVGRDCSLAREHPGWFHGIVAADFPLDPRRDLHATQFLPRFDHAQAADALTRYIVERLHGAADAGVAAFAVQWPQRIPPQVMRHIVRGTAALSKHVGFVAWAPGTTRDERHALREAGFEASFCSLPWWDYRAPWFIDELAQLRASGTVIAPVDSPVDPRDERAMRAFMRAARCSAAAADAWLWRCGNVHDAAALALLDKTLLEVNREFAARDATPRDTRVVSAPWARVPAWLTRTKDSARLTLVNSDLDHHANLAAATLEPGAGVALDADCIPLAPGEVRHVPATTQRAVASKSGERELKAALSAPRIMIENISPAADDGRFAVKRTLGETLQVEADVFADGHPTLCVRLLWRAVDREEWNAVRMRSLGNDRWAAEFPLRRLGCHQYTIEAGLDEFGGLRSDLQTKAAAGQNVALEVEEARQLIDKTARRAPEPTRDKLRALLKDLAAADDKTARVLAPDAAELMAQAATPAFLTRATKSWPVFVERRAARFASWYELFPRSQGKPGVHGTFRDVIAQLPRIAALGFDVLYFTPIHPIGSAHRKGKNNSLHAEPGEAGSPYAIGAAQGGHDAVHPQLGTLDDFRALVAAARAHGLEIALDFAVQCSPDHPWIRQHPEWFAWRPDGSLRFAENPPKKYQDIVNVDFYAKAARPALWTALRDVMAFWMREGVKTFRVDNPHTKPLPFWEWVIADLRTRDPEVIFLSEAFTRPKVMYRLAKLGFAQSYTYFTWRNTRAELTEYLTELNAPPVRDFFRPHFFVNTPDINPRFLHTSGRGGFLIRAALAATLSGLWGMYSGFELCEAAPLPGKEEYLDSEKYELRSRDWDAPGNIGADIALLNRVRRENPALHSNLGISFHHCSNGSVLYFAKSTPARDNVLLVAISLDPHHAQDATIELPLWEWGMDDGGMLLTEDLIDDHAFEWRGKTQQIRLDPSRPFRIWRVRAERER